MLCSETTSRCRSTRHGASYAGSHEAKAEKPAIVRSASRRRLRDQTFVFVFAAAFFFAGFGADAGPPPATTAASFFGATAQ